MEKLSYELCRNTELIPLFLVCAFFIVCIFLLFCHLPAFTCRSYTKKDIRNIILITGVYGIVSFWKLGSLTFPVTTWQPSEIYQQIIFRLPEETSFDAVYAIYGEGDNNALSEEYQIGFHDMEVKGSFDKENWEDIAVIDSGSIYQYKIIEGSWNYPYVRLTSRNILDTMTEFGLRKDDRFIPLEIEEDAAGAAYPATLLIDEQDKLVVSPTCYEQGYFDEVYHPRNAWEIANGQRMYATVHPLLGTNIMALCIRLFGMSPMIWRMPGVIFGILMIPLLYAILKKMFNETTLCTFGCIILATDFMHLTTSRIGTLEPFSVFFILLMFYFMICYYKTSFYDIPLKKQMLMLLACGISMGIAIAVKWTACYSAVGLAILLFTNLGMRFAEYLHAKKKDDETSQRIVSIFPSACITTIAWCFVFFIFIPIIIYWVSYLPDKVWGNEGWSIMNVWKQNMYMYHYHTTLTATHPFQSTWYQWLLDLRPIWYHISEDAQGYTHTIACFSNPLLTWFGLPSVFYTFYTCIKEKDSDAWIIMAGYLTALLPWVSFVERCIFSYHFYPTSMFTIMAMVFLIRDLLKMDQRFKTPMIMTACLSVFLFVIFLPVTAGFATDLSYIHSLEWLKGWYFG